MVEKLWPGETFVCIGGGPSLTQEDVDFLHGRARVIVVNNGYLMAPWADVLWATDASWWETHKGAPSFHGLKFSAKLAGAYEDPRVTLLKCERPPKGTTGLTLDPDAIHHGLNGGHAAMNLAVHLGAARILLLGYDCQPGPSGEEHWHKRHARPKKPEFAKWLVNFASLVQPLQELGIDVVNCTRRTAITCWPQMPIEQALPDLSLEVAS